MPKEKKQFVLTRFMPYMGNKKVLLPLSLVLSALAAVLNILPFVLVWFITREILAAPQALNVSNVGFMPGWPLPPRWEASWSILALF